MFSLRNKNCMPLLATGKLASLHSRSHTQIPSYPAAPFFTSEPAGNREHRWKQLWVSQLLFEHSVSVQIVTQILPKFIPYL